MIKNIKLFLKKLTILSKIILIILTVGIISSLLFLCLSIRYINLNEALFNTNDKTFYKNQGFTIKSRFKYKNVDFNTKELNHKIIFQDLNLKTYETTIIIGYVLNENYIINTNIISDEIILNENQFNDYILNLTTNHNITDLIKDNKNLLKNYIKTYFTSNNYNMYDIKYIWIITPINVK